MEMHPAVCDWKAMADGIRNGEEAAVEQFSQAFDGGLRFLIKRQLGPTGLDGNVRDCVIAVLDAVRRAPKRDLERFVGFVRVVMRDYIANQLALKASRELESDSAMSRSPGEEPTPMNAECPSVAALQGLGRRERDILRRLYLLRQPDDHIRRELTLSRRLFEQVKRRAKSKFFNRYRVLATLRRAHFGSSSRSVRMPKTAPEATSPVTLARGA
jgi:hypothetical protein